MNRRVVQSPEKIIVNNADNSAYYPTASKFFIPFNGAIPFLVRVESPTRVVVYQQQQEVPETDDDDLFDTSTYHRIYTFDNITKIFIPDDDNELKYRGNSLLLKTEKLNEYILISRLICKFHAPSEIVSFSSTVDANYVPSPVAVDEAGRNYILWDEAVLESIPRNEKFDVTWYWVYVSRIPQGLRVGACDYLWTLDLNVNPEQDENSWLHIQRRKGEYDAENLRMQKFGAYVSFDRFNDLHELLALKGDELMACRAEEVFIQNAETEEWELIDFEKYKRLQNEWRIRLKCSPLISTTLKRFKL